MDYCSISVTDIGSEGTSENSSWRYFKHIWQDISAFSA